MKKVAVVTATRAEYGILRPLIYKLHEDKDIVLQLLVTGTHLSEKYGNTQVEIVRDKIPIFRTIDILQEGNTALDVSNTMANALRKFAEFFENEKPDILIVLGDRTEILGICCAAVNANVPIAHLHGGELTEGAIDDCVRHALTKMSCLHFPATEIYRNRIIQMGEHPSRVFNVGALGVENILKVPLLDYQTLCKEVGVPYGKKYVVVTFHPVTMEAGREIEQLDEMLCAMEQKKEYFYLITKANADAGGENINRYLEQFCENRTNMKLVASLGVIRYLSAVKYAEFVLGNSSSGIIEAPALGTPTVNIGDRQKGRLMAETVIQCETKTEKIVDAMNQAIVTERVPTYLYGDGHTSDKMLEIIKKFLNTEEIELKKTFYDFIKQQ